MHIGPATSANPVITIIVFAFVIFLILNGFRNGNHSRTAKHRFLHSIDYGFAPLIGVFILLITLSIDWNIVLRGILGSDRIQPYAIIILFFSLAYVCISIDITGFFEYLALKTAQTAGKSAKKLFLYFSVLAGGLTVFTSNDIVILTLTPIIVYFAKYTKVNPIPYLMGQFFAANIWSIFLYIGNPTNIIVAEAYQLSFLEYTRWMAFPTIVSGLSCLFLLFFIFRKELSIELNPPQLDPQSALKDKVGAIFGVFCLLTCLLFLSIATWINVPLWVICLICACVMLVHDLVHAVRIPIKEKRFILMRNVFFRMPWKIMPFIIGMFILIESLVDAGWVDLIAREIAAGSIDPFSTVFLMTYLAALVCNIMNNQPMTILFTQVLFSPSFTIDANLQFGAMFALIMGSNFGANFTLIGALAGIMWARILHEKNIEISFKQFTKFGFKIMPIVIGLAALTFALELIFWQ